MNINQKIKDICLQLDFPVEFVDRLNIDESVLNSGFYTVVFNDSLGSPLCSMNFIDTSSDDSKSFLAIFDFFYSQEFLKKISFNNYSCSIMFDGDLNFLNLQSGSQLFLTNQKTGGNYYLMTTFQFDIHAELHTIQCYELNNINEEKFSFIRLKENMLSFNDEVFLIDFLRHRHNPSIIEIVPEFYIPSAYDFNSDEFKRRISLVQMMEF